MRAFAVNLVLVFFLAGCGGGANPDKEAAARIPEGQRVGTQKAEIISGQLVFSNGMLEGSGTVRFAEPLPSSDSANNFLLSLEITEGGSVTLIANAQRNLSAGIEIEISRLTGATLAVIARAGSDTLDVSAAFASVNSSLPLAFAIDLHNDHGDSVHFVAWNENAAGALLAEDMIRGKGTGQNWGLRLVNAKVTGIARGAARDQH